MWLPGVSHAGGTQSSNPLCSSGESGANSTPRLRRPASCEPRAWPFHFWRSLVEKAGYKLSDIPNTWDAFLDFFMPVQDKLRAQGMRNVYAYGTSWPAMAAIRL